MPPATPKKRRFTTTESPAVSLYPDNEFHATILGNVLSQGEGESDTTNESADEGINGILGGERVDGNEVTSRDTHRAKLEESVTQGADGKDRQGPKVILDSSGNTRHIYSEILPVYDSEESDPDEGGTTIGNVPLELYDEYPHVGYDINGKKIMRPARGEALDMLLESIDIPKGWIGMMDKNTGQGLRLSNKELEILRKIQMEEIPEEGYDPYAPMIEYFSSKAEIMPLSAAPEPKRRFIPSKHEAKRVMKIVKAIREGRIITNKPKTLGVAPLYDIWADNAPPHADHITNVPAPKLLPPTDDESYNPPPEYLPTPEERIEWEEVNQEDRLRDYLPKKYSSLRLVPGYDDFINQRFQRCLDLYLAPRVRKKKLNIDPESLLPKLPSPEDLRPFPTITATVYRGHEGRVRTLEVDPTGLWLATGGDDGTVRIWEVLTGREIWKVKLGNEAVNSLKWRPGKGAEVLTIAAGDHIFLIVPPIFDPETEMASKKLVEDGWAYAKIVNGDPATKEPPAKWNIPEVTLKPQGVLAVITVRITIKYITWHRRGDYFASVSPEGQSRAVAIHQLSKHSSQLPFHRSKGIVQRVEFHPFRPVLFVATQRYIRLYDLAKSELLKTLKTGARWISSFDVHNGGDNVIIGAYDKRLLWHDLETGEHPYRTLRYHQKAIRQVRYHQGGLPLFASASDDGTIQVFHGKVFNDMMENPLIVPLKILRGHGIMAALGVLDLDWHPRECWLFSAGADGTARLWS